MIEARSLDNLKRDPSALPDMFGLQRVGLQRCPLHDDRNASFSIKQAKSGVWYWRCFAGCGGGTIVDALVKLSNVTISQAIQLLIGGTYTRSKAPRRIEAPMSEPDLPVPDAKLVFDLFSVGFANILEGAAADRLAGRGIFDFSWFERHAILGWVDSLSVPCSRYPLLNSWLFLVTDERWNYLGIKVHRERPFTGSKSFWLRCGTVPADDPRHSYATFWPPPECFDTSAWLCLAPGELKAAALLAAGVNATSPTAGESYRWTPLQIARFKNRRVLIQYDDDPAGHKFRDNTIAALQPVTAVLKADTFGVKDGAP